MKNLMVIVFILAFTTFEVSAIPNFQCKGCSYKTKNEETYHWVYQDGPWNDCYEFAINGLNTQTGIVEVTGNSGGWLEKINPTSPGGLRDDCNICRIIGTCIHLDESQYSSLTGLKTGEKKLIPRFPKEKDESQHNKKDSWIMETTSKIEAFKQCQLPIYSYIEQLRNISGYAKLNSEDKLFQNCLFDTIKNNTSYFNNNIVSKCLLNISIHMLFETLNLPLGFNTNCEVLRPDEIVEKDLKKEYIKFRDYAISNIFPSKSIELQDIFFKSLRNLNYDMKKFNLAEIQKDADYNRNELFHIAFNNTNTIRYEMYYRDFSYFYASLFGIPNEQLFDKIVVYHENMHASARGITYQDIFSITGVIKDSGNQRIPIYIDPRFFNKIYIYNQSLIEEEIGLHKLLTFEGAFDFEYNSILTYCVEDEINKNSCEYYEKCLDRRLKCNTNTGYPLGFAKYYCESYENAIKDLEKTGINSNITKWVDNVKICLKNSTRSFFTKYNFQGTYGYETVYNDETCNQLKTTAFDSHPECYIKNGICEIIRNNKLSFMKLMKKVFMNLKTLKNFAKDWNLWWKQILDVIKSCYGNQIQKAEEEMSDMEKYDISYSLKFLEE